MTNRIENRVLTTPQPMTACWSSFGLVGRAVWAADLDRLQTHPERWEDRLVILTTQRRPSLPFVPFGGPKDGSQ
jgi:hypothetical protein